jgi:hypothetical protein
MEPEVHIIEKYFQEVMHCFTMTNIQLKGKKEIDLLAVNPMEKQYYHIESSIHTMNKLARMDDLDNFQKEKFEPQIVKQKIREVFGNVPYHKMLVVWNANVDLVDIAKKRYGIELQALGGILYYFRRKQVTSGSRDDILRVLELVYVMEKEDKIIEKHLMRKKETLDIALSHAVQKGSS